MTKDDFILLIPIIIVSILVLIFATATFNHESNITNKTVKVLDKTDDMTLVMMDAGSGVLVPVTTHDYSLLVMYKNGTKSKLVINENIYGEILVNKTYTFKLSNNKIVEIL